MTEPLTTALAELDRRSAEATARVSLLSHQLEEAREELTRINQARAALVALLGASDKPEESDVDGSREVEDRPASAPSPSSEDEVAPPPPGGRPRTVDAARALLLEFAEQDVDLVTIRAEFRQRGWLDPDAKAPDALVYAGLRRLEKEDVHVVRTTKKTWRYSADPDRVPHYVSRSAGDGPSTSSALDLTDAQPESAVAAGTSQEPSA